MFRNKKMFYTAITLLTLIIVVNLPYPHDVSFGESVASKLNIPIQSSMGFHYLGISSIILFFASLFLLNNSLEKYNGRMLVLAFILFTAAPSMIVGTFQKTLATGVYAVHYEKDRSNCQFNMIDEDTLRGECELHFVNHSRDEVEFTIEFHERYFFDGVKQAETLMNEGTPNVVRLHKKERRTVRIEKNIDVSTMENHIEGGNSSGVYIIIKSGDKVREL
ncbi:hypothetical protein [Ornithinibacillus californiensis]|uniref:hypothetical protein n=1 Tax=Ornithinibacillus californiensis TaxID=161536 RepID=UPI00064DAAA7|nr:hypothetical protein [Ornithinibacillus californiensis]